MITTTPKAEVSLPSDSEVRVTRSFKAPRELVWRAHTEPALLQRWQLGPPGWTMPVCEMDVRPGGKYRWRWRSDDGGAEFGFYGEFTEVEKPSRIAHTQIYDPGDVGGDMGDEARIVMDLEEQDGLTLLTVTMDFGSRANRDAAMSTGMTDGMELSYQQLDALLAQQSA